MSLSLRPGVANSRRPARSSPRRTKSSVCDTYQAALNRPLIPPVHRFRDVACRGKRRLMRVDTRGFFGVRRAFMEVTRPQQSLILRLDRCVAFAGSLAQTLQVGDLDMSPAVVDEIRLLQRVGDQRYAVAARADHLGQRFLRQHQLTSAG